VRRDRGQSPPPVPFARSGRNPRPFAMALDKPGFDEEFEMADTRGLRLAENGDEFADGQFRLGDKGEQPQTRGFNPPRRRRREWHRKLWNRA